jgi:hypothetical protein
MRFIYPNYRTGLVNKFADHIMLEIDKDNHPLTIIKVTHFTPFFVIEGSTTSKNVLDLEKVKDSFYEKNKSTLESLGINKINTIDLIRYGVEMTDEGPIERFYDFYNSHRPMFNDRVLSYIYNHRDEWEYLDYTDKLVIGTCEMLGPPNFEYFKMVDGSRSSEFPYGYSLKMGRSSLYYSEYICNQLLPSIKADKVSFKFSDILFIIKVNNYICGGFASKVCTLLFIDLKVKLIGTDLHCIGCLQGHGNPRVFL